MKFIKFILGIVDDLLMLAGLGCVTGAFFSLDYRAGFFSLGGSLILYALLIAKTGGRFK